MANRAGDLDWVFLNTATGGGVGIGELISAEAGGLPIYKVMSVRNGRAWLKDIDDGSDRVTLLEAFHWKAVPTNDP